MRVRCLTDHWGIMSKPKPAEGPVVLGLLLLIIAAAICFFSSKVPTDAGNMDNTAVWAVLGILSLGGGVAFFGVGVARVAQGVDYLVAAAPDGSPETETDLAAAPPKS